MKKYIKIMLPAIALALAACGNSKSNEAPENGQQPENPETPSTVTFAKGADISWVTEMEAAGEKFYNRDGVETDCFQLMKELGMNAIRLRVWVNPENGWSGKADVVAKAKRAQAQGMDLMIDFHYSDSWADPGQQFKPAAWKGLPLNDLKAAIANHTTDVLQALKAEGITPKWVQVGNEIRPGMLWDEDASLDRTVALPTDQRQQDVAGDERACPRPHPATCRPLRQRRNGGRSRREAHPSRFVASAIRVHDRSKGDNALRRRVVLGARMHGLERV